MPVQCPRCGRLGMSATVDAILTCGCGHRILTIEDATDQTSLSIFADPWTKFAAEDALEYRLNVDEMLRGSPVRMRYVRRFSTCRVNHDETVAEHSYFVVLYSALIGQWLQRNPQRLYPSDGSDSFLSHVLNWELLMVRAAIHDLEEASSGDFPRHFKHSSPELREHLEDAATKAMRMCLSKLVSPCWAERLVGNWRLAKDSRLEGKVIAFADFLSVLSFVTQEFESGNRNAIEHGQSLRDYFDTFKDSGYEPLRPLIDQVPAIIAGTLSGDAGGSGDDPGTPIDLR